MKRDYIWETMVTEAVLETDDAQLVSKIQSARTLLNMRSQELSVEGESGGVEREAIERALTSLDVMAMERLAPYHIPQHRTP